MHIKSIVIRGFKSYKDEGNNIANINTQLLNSCYVACLVMIGFRGVFFRARKNKKKKKPHQKKKKKKIIMTCCRLSLLWLRMRSAYG